jgi:hypothetical protein
MAGRSQLPVQIMENQTRYDLNAAVENWRDELAAQPNLASDDRRELETHLRDAIAGFQQRGLNDEESFWLARRRVGQPQQLGEEFVKADPAKVWRERLFWMTAGVLVLWPLYQIISSTETIVRWIIFPQWQSNRFIDEYSFCLIPLEIFAIGAFFASRWFTKFFRFFEWLVQKRSRLIASYFCVVIFTSLLQAEAQTEAIKWIDVWHNFLIEIVLSFGFLLLLVWLMPTQNRKTPKRA